MAHFTVTAPRNTAANTWRLSTAQILDDRGQALEARQHPFPIQLVPGMPSASVPLNYPINLVRATEAGLKSLRRPEDVAKLRGKTIAEVLPPRKRTEAAPVAAPAPVVAAAEPDGDS